MSYRNQIRIIESEFMTEPGEPYQVHRTWKERLFTLPWHPLRTIRVVVPQVPMKDALRLQDGTFIVHPASLAAVRQTLDKCEIGFRPESND